MIHTLKIFKKQPPHDIIKIDTIVPTDKNEEYIYDYKTYRQNHSLDNPFHYLDNPDKKPPNHTGKKIKIKKIFSESGKTLTRNSFYLLEGDRVVGSGKNGYGQLGPGKKFLGWFEIPIPRHEFHIRRVMG